MLHHDRKLIGNYCNDRGNKLLGTEMYPGWLKNCSIRALCIQQITSLSSLYVGFTVEIYISTLFISCRLKQQICLAGPRELFQSDGETKAWVQTQTTMFCFTRLAIPVALHWLFDRGQVLHKHHENGYLFRLSSTNVWTPDRECERRLTAWQLLQYIVRQFTLYDDQDHFPFEWKRSAALHHCRGRL